MIKMSPDLIFDLRHALAESREANLEIAKFIRAQCTKGDPLAPVCPNCAASILAHTECADQASNFLAQIQADLDRDKIDSGSPFAAGAGIRRRTFGEDAALDEALGNLHAASLGGKTRTPADIADGLREFADGGKAARPDLHASHRPRRDNLVLEVDIQNTISGGARLILSDNAAYTLRNYLFPSDGK